MASLNNINSPHGTNQNEQDNQEPRSTLTEDIHAVLGTTAHGLLNLTEFWTSVGPTLNEASWGLLGQSFQPERDIPDLTGKVIFITGGNTGLGKETIRQLARHNPARIYLAARNESKAVETIRLIKEELSSSSPSTVDIQYIQLDLTDFSSIKEAAEHFIQNNTRLDILILNAGILAEAAITTPQGHEIQLGTNHIGHFLLTKLLLPLLLKTASPTTAAENDPADVRVITLTSLASGLTPSSLSSPPTSKDPSNNTTPTDLINTILSTPNLFSLTTWQRYAISKAANILFANELARRYPSITSVSVHPGLVASDLYNGTQSTNKLASHVLPLAMKVVFRSVRSGTLNQLWAAAGAGKEQLVNGAYYTPVGCRIKGNRFVEDERLAGRLWEWTDREVMNFGY